MSLLEKLIFLFLSVSEKRNGMLCRARKAAHSIVMEGSTGVVWVSGACYYRYVEEYVNDIILCLYINLVHLEVYLEAHQQISHWKLAIGSNFYNYFCLIPEIVCKEKAASTRSSGFFDWYVKFDQVAQAYHPNIRSQGLGIGMWVSHTKNYINGMRLLQYEERKPLLEVIDVLPFLSRCQLALTYHYELVKAAVQNYLVGCESSGVEIALVRQEPYSSRCATHHNNLITWAPSSW